MGHRSGEAIIDLKLYSRLNGGDVTTIKDIPVRTADWAFNEHKKLIAIPWTAHYRATLVDPLAGGRIARDSDMELYGIGKLRGSE